jgi:hypothetical protein
MICSKKHPFFMLCCKTPTMEWFATNHQTWYDLLQTINLNMTLCNPYFIVLYTKYGLLKNIHLSMICSKPSIFVGFAANHPFLYDLQQSIKLGMICGKPSILTWLSAIQSL